MKFTVKKTVHADEQRRPDVAAARRQWQQWQPLRDVRQYVFLDECGVTTDLLRRYGRSLRATRLHDHTPCRHWQTHTVIAALRLDGLTAPAVFDGPIDTPSFRAYVEQVLSRPFVQATSSCATTWRSTSNPRSAPRSQRRRDAPISPPLQPGLQSVEQAFAKLKALLRAARPRSFNHVCELIATAIGLFEPAECANYVRHSGYLVAR